MGHIEEITVTLYDVKNNLPYKNGNWIVKALKTIQIRAIAEGLGIS